VTYQTVAGVHFHCGLSTFCV